MRTAAIVLAASLALAAETEVAAQEEDFGRRGAYVGGGFVYGFENFDLGDVSSFVGEEVSASGSPGVDVRGGYRFNQYVALEGNLDYYANFNIEAAGIDVLSVSAFSLFGNVKGYPSSGRIQPYGLFGLGVLGAQIGDEFDLDTSATDATFGVRLGGGVDVYVTEKFLLNLDVGYVFATSDMSFGGGPGVRTDLIPLALTGQWRF